MRNNLFSGAAFTGNKHGCITIGSARYNVEYLPHLRTLIYKRKILKTLFDCFIYYLIFMFYTALLKGPHQEVFNFFFLRRLYKIVVAALLKNIYSIFCIFKGGHDNYMNGRISLLYVFKQFQTGGIRQAVIT